MAASSARRALALDPLRTGALHNLALAAGNISPSALPYFRAALAESPSAAGTHNNLGLFLARTGHSDQALQSLWRSIRLQPFDSAAYVNAGMVLQSLNRFGEAMVLLRAAFVCNPADADIGNNLGVAELELGGARQAVRSLARAAALRPSTAAIGMNAVMARLYHPGENWRSIAEATADFVGRLPQAAATPIRDDGRERPKIGFVSSDFRAHAVGYLVLPAIEALAARGFEVHCYDNAPLLDGVGRRLRNSANFHDIRGLRDDQAARLIADDGIDILFDLCGYTTNSRLLVFHHRPAPLQLAWLAYPATTGLSEMDYILADSGQFPDEAAAFFTEKPIFLPHNYSLYEPAADFPYWPEPPAERNGFITFGSFNSLKKLTPQMLAAWTNILREVPGSRLFVKNPALSDQMARSTLMRRLRSEDVAEERIRLLGATSPEEHCLAMAEADIGLDSFPYSGGLTTLDCLWMGLPVVTCPAESFAGRHSLGYLSSLGMTDLIAKDMKDFARIAVELARDGARLAALRSGLRLRMAASTLCQKDHFGDMMSRMLTTVWQRHRRGLPPEATTIPAE